MKRLILPLVLSTLVYSCKTAQSSSCPGKEETKQALSKLINREFKVEEVRPMAAVEGLCEVVLKVGLNPVVLYTDRKAKTFILGNAVDVETKEDLTRKVANQYATVSQDTLKELQKHVNMTYGKGEKYVYYITDPDCPFCRRFSPMLKEWADKSNVQIRVILYPLPIHPQAKPKAVAMVCDGKGYEDIHAELSTKNQCEEGKEAIEGNLKFLEEVGVSGTPTVIGMNGRYVVGLPRSPEELEELIR